MSSVFEDMVQALRDHEQLQQTIVRNGNHMLRLLDGNLRDLSGYRLAEIKRQLRDFNIQTHRWSK